MWKLRIGVLVTSGVFALGLTSTAWAASGGDANAGDAWVDNVGQPAGPGHEMDPHLACQDINLWGSGLSDGSGTYSIDSWAPSGSQEVDYSGTWSYSQSSGRQAGDQVIAVIDVSKLMHQAQSNGDLAAAQGLHFKLDFSQDPQKHKTFWIDCTSGSSGGGSNGGDGGTTNGGGDGGTTTNAGGTTTGATTTSGAINTPAVTTSPGAVKTSIGGIATSRRTAPKKKKKHGRLLHPARHRKVRSRHVKFIKVNAPRFTG